MKAVSPIIGYRLNGTADRFTVDKTLGHAMPTWDDNDKSIYFIKGHLGGSLIQKARQLCILDIWFEPIYLATKDKLTVSDLIIKYNKDSVFGGGQWLQTKLTPIGRELLNKAKIIKKTYLIDIRQTITPTQIIKWQVIGAAGAGCTDLQDTYEIEITDRKFSSIRKFFNEYINQTK